MAIPTTPGAHAPAPQSTQSGSTTGKQQSVPNIQPGKAGSVKGNVQTDANGVANIKNQTESNQAQPEQTFEFTVDGQTRKYTLEQLKKIVPKAGFADKTVQQNKDAMLAIKKKEAEIEQYKRSIQEAAAKDPAEVLKLLNVDPDAYVREYINRKITEEGLSPEQRRIAELERQAKTYQERQEVEAAKVRQTKLAEKQTKLQDRMMGDLAKARERAGMEENAANFAAVIDMVSEFADAGMDWDPDYIVELAQKKQDATFNKLEEAVVNGLSGQALTKRLGEKVVKAVLQAELERIRGAKTFGKAQPPVQTQTQTQPAKSTTLSVNDFDRLQKERLERLEKLGK